LIFLGVNIVGNHVNFIDIAEPLAKRLDKRSLAGTNWSADADSQWLTVNT
jgi:hypothetical protein